jgi:hypothetical protein
MLPFCGTHVPVLIYSFQRHALLLDIRWNASYFWWGGLFAAPIRNYCSASKTTPQSECCNIREASSVSDGVRLRTIRLEIRCMCTRLRGEHLSCHWWISQIGDGESVLGMRLLCFEIRFAPPYKNISANMTKRYRLAANSDTLDTQDRK